jgi:arginine deiminase
MLETGKHQKVKKNMKLHHFDTVFSFGQHKGETVAEVLEKNPTYLVWCYGNIDNFCATDAVWKIIEEHTKIKGLLNESGIDHNEVRKLLANNQKIHEEKKENYKNYKMERYSKKLDVELSGSKK